MRVFTEEHRKRLSKALRGNKCHSGKSLSPGARMRISEANLGNQNASGSRDSSSRENIRQGVQRFFDNGGCAWNKGLTNQDPRVKSASRKRSDRFLELWADPLRREVWIRQIIRGNSLKPNYKELELNRLLDTLFPGEYRYVGNGELILGGKNPDFMNVNGQKKLIELFGEQWHLSGEQGRCPGARSRSGKSRVLIGSIRCLGQRPSSP